MVYEVTCQCGWNARGTDEELVPLVQQHGKEVHSMEVTPEQARAQFKPVEA